MQRHLAGLLAVIAILLGPAQAMAGPVNVNTADAATISAELKGIGLRKAEAIVAYRKANGPFREVEDLMKVKGIGRHTLEANREHILLKAPQQKRK